MGPLFFNVLFLAVLASLAAGSAGVNFTLYILDKEHKYVSHHDLHFRAYPQSVDEVIKAADPSGSMYKVVGGFHIDQQLLTYTAPPPCPNPMALSVRKGPNATAVVVDKWWESKPVIDQNNQLAVVPKSSTKTWSWWG